MPSSMNGMRLGIEEMYLHHAPVTPCITPVLCTEEQRFSIRVHTGYVPIVWNSLTFSRVILFLKALLASASIHSMTGLFTKHKNVFINRGVATVLKWEIKVVLINLSFSVLVRARPERVAGSGYIMPTVLAQWCAAGEGALHGIRERGNKSVLCVW